MQIDVYKGTKIFVVCPAKGATGGPELLHQFAHKMNTLAMDAVMYYYPPNLEDPVHPFYEQYENRYVREIDDNEKNILMIPEIRTDLVYKYPKIRKIIWWLSVNNFPRYPKNWKAVIKVILRSMREPKWCYRFEPMENLYHLVQSEYARNYLLKKGIKQERIDYLSDYINPLFILKQKNNEKNISKEDIVAYNPKKGYEFTQKIIEAAKDIQFVPIVNMTPDEVAELLLRAKLYIDFGNHPGKDRIPREAAISNCCVIVGKRGAAKFKEDVPIDDEYKFDVKERNIRKIVEKIRYVLKNYDSEIKKFEAYRQYILNEETRFEEDIKRIFKAR